MLDFDTAQSRLISAGKIPATTETVALEQSNGRILAQAVIATLDLPPADNSAMDGYAINFADYTEGKSFAIQQRSYAGDTPEPLKPGMAIRLFTGSIMPEGANTVVMQEYATETDNAVVFTSAPEEGRHVRYRGEDVAQGTNILQPGTLIGPGEIALLASQGIHEIAVYPKLKVGILTTGDELVKPGQNRQPEQIFNSNGPMLASMFERMGTHVALVSHAPDTPEAITAAFKELLEKCDLVVTVGGVSVGDKDLVKPTIESLGGQLNLWRVSMKPGKPVALARANNKPIVCLPGNPVSAFVVFTVLVAPLVKTMQGYKNVMPAIRYGKLSTKRVFKGSRDDFIRVNLQESDNGIALLTPHMDQGSGIISSLTWASGVARIPANTTATDGSIVAYYEFSKWLNT